MVLFHTPLTFLLIITCQASIAPNGRQKSTECKELTYRSRNCKFTTTDATITTVFKSRKVVIECHAEQGSALSSDGLRYIYSDLNMSTLNREVNTLHFISCPTFYTRLRTYLIPFHIKRLIGVKFHSLSASIINPDFFRGVTIQRLELKDMDRVELDARSLPTSLQSLVVKNTSLQMNENTFVQTHHLYSLELNQCNLSRIGHAMFATSSKLKSVDLSNNPLIHIHPQLFNRLPILHSVSLYKTCLHMLNRQYFRHSEQITTIAVTFDADRCAPMTGRSPACDTSTAIDRSILGGLGRLETLYVQHVCVHRVSAALFADQHATLRHVTLVSAGLRHIESHSLSGLQQLYSLNVKHNPLDGASIDTILRHTRLSNLDISFCNLTRLNMSILTAETSLTRINASHNRLQNFDISSTNAIFSTIKVVDLSFNLISKLEIDTSRHLPSIERLLLNNNRLSQMSVTHTGRRQVRFTLQMNSNHIRALNMSQIQLQLTNSDLYAKRNPIEHIYAGSVVTRRPYGRRQKQQNQLSVRIYVDDKLSLLCDCHSYDLIKYLHVRSIWQRVELMTSKHNIGCQQLRDTEDSRLITIDPNQLRCQIDTGSQHCTGNLYIRSRLHIACNTSEMNYTRLGERVFSQVGDSVSTMLDVSGRSLHSLPDISAWRWTNITVNASHNAIDKLEATKLPAVGLTALYLSHNRLTSVDEHDIRRLRAINTSSLRLTLGHNPFACDCAIRPLVQLVRETAVRVHVQDWLLCVDKRVLARLDTLQLCQLLTPLQFSLVVCALVVLLVLLVALVAGLYFPHLIRMWLRSRFGKFLRLKTQASAFTYDAFVSYANKDEPFVTRLLIPRLENNHPKFKLCVHFRDWLAGEWIAEQIQHSISNSRCTLAVISDHYLASNWSKQEFIEAYNQTFGDRSRKIICIVIGNLPKQLDPDSVLYKYLKLNTYISSSDPLFMIRLKNAMSQTLSSKDVRKRNKIEMDRL